MALRLRQIEEADPAQRCVATEHYDIVVAREVVGTIQLRLGNSDDLRLYGGHVGYGVEPEHRGHGYARAALMELRSIARGHGFEEIWIMCQPENAASCRTLEHAGAILERTIDVPLDSDLYARGLLINRYRLVL